MQTVTYIVQKPVLGQKVKITGLGGKYIVKHLENQYPPYDTVLIHPKDAPTLISKLVITNGKWQLEGYNQPHEVQFIEKKHKKNKHNNVSLQNNGNSFQYYTNNLNGISYPPLYENNNVDNNFLGDARITANGLYEPQINSLTTNSYGLTPSNKPLVLQNTPVMLQTTVSPMPDNYGLPTISKTRNSIRNNF